MNPKETYNELEYHAALMRFSKIDKKRIQAIFDSLMKNGIFHEEFLDIKYPSSDNLADFIAHYGAALKKLNCNAPKDQDEAVWIILRYHIKKIADSESEPFEGLSKIINDVYWSYDFHSRTVAYLGDSHGIHHLVSLYWRRDALLENSSEGGEISALNRELVDEARSWLEKYPLPS